MLGRNNGFELKRVPSKKSLMDEVLKGLKHLRDEKIKGNQS
jgi:hypothetical protein